MALVFLLFFCLLKPANANAEAVIFETDHGHSTAPRSNAIRVVYLKCGTSPLFSRFFVWAVAEVVVKLDNTVLSEES